jgi:transcriptional regulator with XRE-family HTH domain
MVMKLTPNGQKIKGLRTGQKIELPRKTLAAQCGISERQLQRIENENLVVGFPTLNRLADKLGVAIEDIVSSAHGATAPSAVDLSTSPARKTERASSEPETIQIPRHTTTGLAPVASAQALYELAEWSMEIKPHMLADAAPAQMTMIEECLSLLKVVSKQRWSCGKPVPPDAHDGTDFPEMSCRKRLAELFVLIKGHDIRILANREMYRYPPDETPWLEGQSICWHLVIAFAPPRGEYEEETVSVPFDGGCDIVLPYKPIY